MDHVELTVAALIAGAAAGGERSVSAPVRDAYRTLRQLVRAQFSSDAAARAVLAGYEINPQRSRLSLEMALRNSGLPIGTDVIAVARRLMGLIETGGRTAARYSSGMPRRPDIYPSVPADGERMHRGLPSGGPVIRPSAAGRPAAVRPVPVRSGPAKGSRSAAPESFGPRRVILIERSSGIQVGWDNDQYSVYQVTLPSAALQSAQALADQLLRLDAPWSGDAFSNNARPRIAGAAVGSTVSSSGIVAGPGGDTLVIVRNSSGVQIGDHNVQHNIFRIRVANVTVEANRLGVSPAREALVARLREDPRDRAAARSLAGDVARAASRDLVVDLTARVTRDVGQPQVGWRPVLRDESGRQVGDANRAHMKIQVTVSKFDSRALQRGILRSAGRLARSAAGRYQPGAPRRAPDGQRASGLPPRPDPGVQPGASRPPVPDSTRTPGRAPRPGPGGGRGFR